MKVINEDVVSRQVPISKLAVGTAFVYAGLLRVKISFAPNVLSKMIESYDPYDVYALDPRSGVISFFGENDTLVEPIYSLQIETNDLDESKR